MPATRRHAPAYQLKVTLRSVRPPIWRRLVVPGQWHLGRVNQALQRAMGWSDSHLHEFDAGGRRIGVPDPDWDDEELEDEAKVRLQDVLTAVGDRLLYSYDFGDGWQHVVEVEGLLAPATKASCLTGRRACPPENCGGPWGYAELLAAISDPAHPDHQERVEWVGPEFHPEAFDLAEINADLSEIN